jgi:hypothetical protein
MSRPFKPYIGKNTFGVHREPQDAGEYILNKSSGISCHKNNCQLPYKITNLNINLVTSLDLTSVPVIQQNFPLTVPTNLDVTSIPYIDYTIDPCGNLFGNTICGTNNFQNYLRISDPYATTNPGYINNL